MARNIFIILVGIIPASFLSLFALVFAAVGVGMIRSGELEGWLWLFAGAFGVVGTAALFACVLFRVTALTIAGLVVGIVAAVWALFSDVTSSDSGFSDFRILIIPPIVVGLYVLIDTGFFGRWAKSKLQRRDG